jgi:ATP-dependent DNA helicase PIF1
MSYDDALYDRIELSMKIAHMNTLKNFVKSVFSVNLMTNAHHDFDNFNDRAILAMHNDTVRKLNDLILQSLQNQSHTLNFVDSIENETQDDALSSKFLRTLKSTSLSSSRLRLKVDALVMLLRNMYFKRDLCNDTRLMITRVSRTMLKNKILSESMNEETRLISRILVCNTKKELT